MLALLLYSIINLAFFCSKADLQPFEYIVLRKSEIDLREILKSAQPIVHQSITTFSNLREDIWSELTNVDKVGKISTRAFFKAVF